MEQMNPVQVRVLACLVEKESTTPDQYPLTLNALRTACNQKSARDPVTAFTEGEVGHAARELEGLGFVREVWGARTPKYEHRMGAALSLHGPGVALLATLMLRGPQTLGELKSHSARLHAFGDLDDVHYQLEKMAAHEPPLVVALPRQPGQKEGRYAHLLAGEPEVSDLPQRAAPRRSGLEERVAELEEKLQQLAERLEMLESRS